jgi:opacity protein-like surface antigen
MRIFCLCAASILALAPGASFAQCAANDTICKQTQADKANQGQQDQQRTDQLNKQNGTSQYSGPKCYQTENGTTVCGYQKSTP